MLMAYVFRVGIKKFLHKKAILRTNYSKSRKNASKTETITWSLKEGSDDIHLESIVKGSDDSYLESIVKVQDGEYIRYKIY